jgi:hypothetical protein
MDTIVNAPFKKALVKTFRNYLHCLFDKRCDDGRPPTEFSVNLGEGTLKPMLPFLLRKGWRLFGQKQYEILSHTHLRMMGYSISCAATGGRDSAGFGAVCHLCTSKMN